MRLPRAHPAPLLAALAALLLVASATAASGQVAYDAPLGRVEILGLHKWSVAALRDSIRRRVPGQTLEDAACMITLRDSLHFADALVSFLSYSEGPGEKEQHWLIIKVVEPQESARVRWLPTPGDSLVVLRPAFAPLILGATDSLGQLWLGRLFEPLQAYHRDSATRAAAFRRAPRERREDAERLWSFLDAHRTDADRRTALGALRGDRFYPNRVVAAAMLANFSEQDSTWWALADALRDGNEAVRSAALFVLNGLPPRTVDWAPKVQTLRALLGGTNVSATQDLIALLDRTRIDPSLARPLLHDNHDWLRTHLRAEYPGARYSAHALLVRLNAGRDLGTADAAWTRWLASL